MSNNAPGKQFRKGVGIADVIRMFSTANKAYDWLASYILAERTLRIRSAVRATSCAKGNIRQHR